MYIRILGILLLAISSLKGDVRGLLTVSNPTKYPYYFRSGGLLPQPISTTFSDEVKCRVLYEWLPDGEYLPYKPGLLSLLRGGMVIVGDVEVSADVERLTFESTSFSYPKFKSFRLAKVEWGDSKLSDIQKGDVSVGYLSLYHFKPSVDGSHLKWLVQGGIYEVDTTGIRFPNIITPIYVLQVKNIIRSSSSFGSLVPKS